MARRTAKPKEQSLVSEQAEEMGINLISSSHVETVALMVRE